MARRHKHVRRKRPHSFAETPQVRMPRSRFDRSHGNKLTFDAGWLIPVFLDEVLPGDTFNLSMTAFARMVTLIKPVMDNLYLESFFFFVPNRLVWENWQRFCGEEPNPGDSTDFLIPRMNSGTAVVEGSMADYFGIPIGLLPTTPATSERRLNQLPFRCYNVVWNEWFRDENLQDRATEHKDDALAEFSDFPLRRRGKRHDYFTSALPWPQKGDAVMLPLGESAFIHTGAGATDNIHIHSDDTDDVRAMSPFTGGGEEFIRISADAKTANENRMYANLTDATAATINQLRQAFQVQKLLERNARGGTRYTEIIRAHFGVMSPDQRLQRPEYLGGGRTMVNVQPVPQTSRTITSGGDESPLGELAATGTATAHGHGFVKSFTEHGHVIGLVSVRADLNYQQGLHRMWSRETRFDFYWPSLAKIGEQAVLSKEIFVGNDANDDDVFGYQERYAEYRYKPSQVTAAFRSDAATSLDVWHLAQDFAARPTLNDTFIQEDPPVDRVVAVPSEPHFIMDTYFSYRCARPMPVFGTPGLIDHF